MTWTVTKEEADDQAADVARKASTKLNVRAVIDLSAQQHELKDLIAALQKHVVEPSA